MNMDRALFHFDIADDDMAKFEWDTNEFLKNSFRRQFI